MNSIFVCGICDQKLRIANNIICDSVPIKCPKCKTIHQYVKELPIDEETEYKNKKIKLCGRQHHVKKNKRRKNIK